MIPREVAQVHGAQESAESDELFQGKQYGFGANDNTPLLRSDSDDCQGVLIANVSCSILSNTMYVVVEQSWTKYIRIDEENQLDPFVFTV